MTCALVRPLTSCGAARFLSMRNGSPSPPEQEANLNPDFLCTDGGEWNDWEGLAELVVLQLVPILDSRRKQRPVHLPVFVHFGLSKAVFGQFTILTSRRMPEDSDSRIERVMT